MQEPVPIGVDPQRVVNAGVTRPVMVAQTQREAVENITKELNNAGNNVKPEEVSAQVQFPTGSLQEIGAEIVHDTGAYLGETYEELTEGSQHIRTGSGGKGSLVSSLREKLRQKLFNRQKQGEKAA